MIEKFWRRLAALSPKLGPGFSAIEKDGRPGIYIIDSDGDWRAGDFARFDETVRTASREFGISTSAEHFQVEYAEIGNDWKTDPQGASYLDRLSNEGRSDLRRRLVRLYRPRVERWIRNAFKKYAPRALRESRRAEDRWLKDHFSSAPLLYRMSLLLLSFRHGHGDGARRDVAMAVRGGDDDGVDAARAAA